MGKRTVKNEITGEETQIDDGNPDQLAPTESEELETARKAKKLAVCPPHILQAAGIRNGMPVEAQIIAVEKVIGESL